MADQGRPDEVQPALDWMASLPHRKKIVVPGNHDVTIGWEELRWYTFAADLGLQMAFHNEVFIGTGNKDKPYIKAFCSAWTPAWGRGWAFMAERGSDKLRMLWDRIPEDTELLITHGPPKGILDEEEREGFLCGCEILREKVKKLPKLKYHLFGHIHEHGGGVHEEDGVTFVNLSMVNRQHKPTNQPFVFELD